MRHWRWRSKLLLGLGLLVFAYFVWPTPWTYYQVNDAASCGGSNPYLASAWQHAYWVRVNRFNGRSQRLTGYRHGYWKPLRPWR